MPLYEFTFTDTTTIQVNAPDADGARRHVEKLLAKADALDDTASPYHGKALASGTGRLVDKFKEREAQNKLLRG